MQFSLVAWAWLTQKGRWSIQTHWAGRLSQDLKLCCAPMWKTHLCQRSTVKWSQISPNTERPSGISFKPHTKAADTKVSLIQDLLLDQIFFTPRLVPIRLPQANVTSSTNSTVGESGQVLPSTVPPSLTLGQPSANLATAEPKKLESLFDKATFKIRTQPGKASLHSSDHLHVELSCADLAILHTHRWAYQVGVYRGLMFLIVLVSKLSVAFFLESPQIHMAYDLKELPEIMWPYNALKPQSLYEVIMKNLTFIDYQIGALIIKLNSVDGITILSFMEIMSAAQKCSGCCCVFSPEGYHAHLGYNEVSGFTSHCCNSPLLPVGKCSCNSTGYALSLTMSFLYSSCVCSLCAQVSRNWRRPPKSQIRLWIMHGGW